MTVYVSMIQLLNLIPPVFEKERVSICCQEGKALGGGGGGRAVVVSYEKLSALRGQRSDVR